MTYRDITDVYDSHQLMRRVIACAAVEGSEDPEGWVSPRRWKLAAQPGWAEAWASFKASNPSDDPGLRDDVVTDGMILAAVQSLSAG